jgi:uncharacterized protein (DUF4415 family)
MKKVSLDEIERMNEQGKLHHNPNAPEGEALGEEFWANAVLVEPKGKRSVHLKLDPEVFDFFRKETGGKGHLTRMQTVLKAYVNARKRA